MEGNEEIKIEESEKREHYVYIYLDPRKTDYVWKFEYQGVEQWFDLEPFYVGLGKNDRMLHHLYNNKEEHKNELKFYLVQKLKRFGYDNEYFRNFLIIKVATNLTIDEANIIEEQLVKRFGKRRIDRGGILTNRRNGGYGVGEYSQELRDKINSKRNICNPNSLPVVEINENKEIINRFPSINNVSKNTGKSASSITARLLLTANSYDWDSIFVFEHIYNDIIEFPNWFEKLKFLKENCNRYTHIVRKKVLMIDMDKRILNIFKSIDVAAEKTDLSYTKISDSFHNFDYKLVNGGILLYEETFNDEEKLEIIFKRINDNDERIVLLDKEYNFIKVFENIVEASKETKVKKNNISQYLGGWALFCKSQYVFIYYNVYNNPDEFKKWFNERKNKKPQKRKIAVYDLNENFIQEFDSMSDGMRFFGFKYQTQIRNVALGLGKSAYGYIWKYLD